ncbi:recombinase family protein [Ramlibacter sp. MMS24-I3-19]|uniref:recombinase family protein n=1 Tax=Ramlibacter sp. MMS24-I3-19 TaxID=3416606 RepID=UPI003CFD220A
MSVTGAYARYSPGNGQRETSIEDQLRRCRQVAEREGLAIDENFVFADQAITGKAEGLAKRTQYRRLLDAIEARECSIVIVDEISRLTRHVREGGRLMDLVDEMGVRFLTNDGIDTLRDGWRALWMVKLMAANMEVESTGSRTTRGMVGQLERGYQIAQAPYGYRAIPEVTDAGKVLGTKWSIHEPEAEVIRRIYAWRHQGLSCPTIAATLQREGVLPPGSARKRGQVRWRAASVHRLMSNQIYRGLFIWNGSGFTKARARKKRKEVKELPFARPQLRLVSDELWFSCNPRGNGEQRSHRPRGGGKNVFSGLVRCGVCDSLLSIGSNKGMNCPGCYQAKRVGAVDQYMGYTSVTAAKLALEWVLAALFTGEVRQELNKRLTHKLHTGPAKELEEVTGRLKDIEANIDRIQEFMLNPNLDPAIWVKRLEGFAQSKQACEHRLSQLRSASRKLTPAVLQAQVHMDPLPALRELLDGQMEAYKVRATLRRLLATFTFVAKPSRYVSVFRLALQPGVCLAELSDTDVIDNSLFQFEVTCSTTASRPVVWHVSGRAVSA